MKGIFNLSNADDLLEKVHHDITLLEETPDDSYRAFNYFVTAEHLLDWILPKKENKDARERIQNRSIPLQICSHIANGAKHFEVEARHHRSVSDTDKIGGYWPENYWLENYWPKGHFLEASLIIRLDGDAKNEYGESIQVVHLAKEVLDFWDKYFNQ